jgi:hypothetical protein
MKGLKMALTDVELAAVREQAAYEWEHNQKVRPENRRYETAGTLEQYTGRAVLRAEQRKAAAHAPDDASPGDREFVALGSFRGGSESAPAPALPAARSDGATVDYFPDRARVEAECRSDWSKSASLRNEFGGVFERYVALTFAERQQKGLAARREARHDNWWDNYAGGRGGN